MADVKIADGKLLIKLSLLDRMLSFSGSFEIPLEHVTNAFESNLDELELQKRFTGEKLAGHKAPGFFGSPAGIIFVDAPGDRDCLVIETRGEIFSRIAVQLPEGEEPNALAHEIMQAVPDSGPDEHY
jgi:hypothetical protein